STVEIFLNELGKRIKNEGIEVFGVPSSYKSHLVAIKNGIKIVDLFQYSELDLCIDGADQIDQNLNCIKGGGGALTREKIIASASKKFIIIADESKLVDKLNMPIPVEILPFAYGFVVKAIKELGGECLIRECKGKLGPIISDNGNFIVDCSFGVIDKPRELEIRLNNIPGVIENGIFCNDMIDKVIIGSKNGFKIL
ncbi:MAG TPA: ribose 5-phosphate isomerase A, partial [Archaeoglobus profundus]|nr:ribose 5-phosphate isomerase A [Archaeoglobus profundus]